jgi:hypothetical protein
MSVATEQTAGEQLIEIMRDLERTGAAHAAAGYGHGTPEDEAREAAYARLDEWNRRYAR